jgi:large repetitive protein
MSRKRTSCRPSTGVAALVLAVLLPLLASSALAQTSEYQLLVSLSPDRSSPVALEGQSVAGSIYVFTSPDSGASRVRFYVDDPTMAGTPRVTEKLAPFDLGGTASDDTAKPFDTKRLSEGSHTLTAAIELAGGGERVLNSTFTVKQLPELKFVPSSLSFSRREDDSAVSQTATLSATDSSAAAVTLTTDAPWLSATLAGPTPTDVTVTADPTGLALGSYNGRVTASASGYVTASLPVSFKVTSADWCSDISPLACSEVLVRFPYQLDFGSDAGMLSDANLVGTGFTMVDPAANGAGYAPSKLNLDTQAETLSITR